MLYSSTEIDNIISLANSTLWNLPIKSDEVRLMTGETELENEIDIIYLLKKAVEYGKDVQLSDENFEEISGYLLHKCRKYGFSGAVQYFEEAVYTASGATSGTITILSQPVNLTKNETQSATFSVTATGTGNLSYQWQRLVGGSWVDVAGAISASYTIASVIEANEGTYRVVITDDNGRKDSNSATLTVNQAVAVTYIGYSGFSDSDTIVSEAQILAFPVQLEFAHNANATADFRSNSVPKYLHYAELATEPVKTYFFFVAGNEGAVPGTLLRTYLVGSYRVYSTNYQTYNNSNVMLLQTTS